jgi:hypothetical protein
MGKSRSANLLSPQRRYYIGRGDSQVDCDQRCREKVAGNSSTSGFGEVGT